MINTLDELLDNFSYTILLKFCLLHYDELYQQLNDELDKCNYFGEDL